MTQPRLLWLVLACCLGCEAAPPPAPDLPSSNEALTRGRQSYLRYCAHCHGERGDGQGKRRLHLPALPDFRARAWRDAQSSAKLYVTLRDGVAGTAMPAWGHLGEQRLRELSAHLLSLAEAAD